MSENRFKILIVDDSPEWIKYHLSLLNSYSGPDCFDIDFEMSAKSGFNRVLKNSKTPYNLIISDLEMEEILEESYAGAWFVRNILKREECKDSKIIIISGSHDIKEVAEEFKVDFIPKHILHNNPDILGYKLKEVLLMI